MEFWYHSPNEVIPFLTQCVPPQHKWRLNGVRTFKEAMEQLMVLASTEDTYIESLITDIRNKPQ